MKVLHVAESYGGGIEVIIKTFLDNTDDNVSHALACGDRAEDRVFDHYPSEFKSVDKGISKNLFSSLWKLFVTYRRFKPDYVHLHSSFAGFIGRVALFIPRKKILYSPHGFAFQKSDQKKLVRKIYYFVEYILAYRSKAIVASGRGEEVAALTLKGAQVIYVPNFSDLEKPILNVSKKHKQIVMSGRITPQKDPTFFIDVIHLMNKDNDYKFVWIGDGDKVLAESLKSAGVVMAGWVSRDEHLEIMANSSLCFHCAAWEGNPLSVLDACALGLPTIVRDIEAFSYLDDQLTASTPKQAAALINSFFEDGGLEPIKTRDTINQFHSRELCQEALREIYS